MSKKILAGQASVRGRLLPICQGGFIVLFVFLAYLPALPGRFVWDDDSWTTNLSPLFQTVSGLGRIWFQPTALQQYYPLSGTSFWVEYQLWNFRTTPYHVDNLLLHILAALLLWRLLVRLKLPGAWLASAVFALHPVMVESVAWITERKNVLSLVFYLGSLLAYERYAQWRDTVNGSVPVSTSLCEQQHPVAAYGWSLVLFLCAMLAKTTAFSLPAVILLICWWKQGKIRWRTDVLPALPFFALALGLCAVTAWLEQYHVGAKGSHFDLTFPQRCLIAGRALWFYPGKLFWPADLCFIYPRWQPDPRLWWQWLFPATAVGILLAVWLARNRIGRGPATALFFYAGTLFPVLGFMNAYGIRYSFVWDHWVYLSAIGIIVAVVALVVRLAESLRTPTIVYGSAAVVLPVLTFLTWRQAGQYTDTETLWRRTLATNPDCWLAHNNLGLLLKDQGHTDEAIQHYEQAIQINPTESASLVNLGIVLASEGRLDEAIADYHKALQIDTNSLQALNNLGLALASQGRFDEAAENYRRAVQINPRQPGPHSNLAAILAQLGRWQEAVSEFDEALRLDPGSVGLLNNLAFALAASPVAEVRNGARAVQLAERACSLTHYGQPAYLNTLAVAYAECGRFPEAITTAGMAEQLATRAGLTDLAEKSRERLELFRADKPYHEPK